MFKAVNVFGIRNTYFISMTFISLYVQNLKNLVNFHTKVSKFNVFEYLECYLRHYFSLALYTS